jgi:hypothetical protein
MTAHRHVPDDESRRVGSAHREISTSVRGRTNHRH